MPVAASPVPGLLSRRALIAAAALAPLARAVSAEEALIRRPIPSTGERLPVIGIGTSRRYEVAPTAEAVAPLRAAVERDPVVSGCYRMEGE